MPNAFNEWEEYLAANLQGNCRNVQEPYNIDNDIAIEDLSFKCVLEYNKNQIEKEIDITFFFRTHLA